MTESTTYDGSNGSQVLKIDTKGRVRSTAAQREAVVREFERSGLSGARFAAVAGIKYQTLAVWLRKARRSSQDRGSSVCGGSGQPSALQPCSSRVRWVEAVPGVNPRHETGAGVQVLRVQLRGGMELHINTADQVGLAAALLRALEGGAASC